MWIDAELFVCWPSEWNKYHEAEPSQADRLLGSMEEGGAQLQRALGQSFKHITTGVSSVSSTVQTTVQTTAQR
jgi:hypothetical protein